MAMNAIEYQEFLRSMGENGELIKQLDAPVWSWEGKLDMNPLTDPEEIARRRKLLRDTLGIDI